MRSRLFDYLRLACLLTAALSFATTVNAQQEPEPAREDTAQAAAEPDSGQVEANEDLYRQLMELKDGVPRRVVAPQESWQSRSRLQKLDELPEESQKHLRNQLREIIVEGGAWQPGDENREYAYVPSAAAQASSRLQKQEAEAWSELLDNYHAREAQIYANAERSRAASAAAAAMQGTMQGEMEQGAADAEGRNAQAGQQGRQGAASATEPDSFAPGQQNNASARNQQGVAQSAMEFLQNTGYQPARGQAGQQAQQSAQTQAGQQPQPPAQGVAGADAQQSPAQAGAESSAQQAAQSVNAATAADAAQTMSISLPSQASAGAEQNAMQFLQQADSIEGEGTQQAGENDAQNGQASTAAKPDTDVDVDLAGSQQASGMRDEEPATEGVSQSALEYLSGQQPPEPPADTLSIEDLLNAGGLGAEPIEEVEPDAPDKDG